MSFNKINELRKVGDLDKALILAEENYNQNSEYIWNKRALAWVYYDYCKKYSEENDTDLFLDYINKIKELKLSSDEKILFDSLIWVYSKIFNSISKSKNIDYNKANKVKASLSNLYFTTPSEGFSSLITALHKVYKDSNEYIKLADKVFLKFLRKEDFFPTEYDNRRIIPLAEQIYTTYCKTLLKGKKTFTLQNNFLTSQQNNIDIEKIKLFLPQLDKIIDKYPNYTYLPYYKVKLLIAIEDKAPIDALLPFVKTKKNDFWVWDLMSEVTDNDELAFSCLCKSLSLKTPEQFLPKIRTKIADIFIQKKLYNEAKTEINKVINSKMKNEQKIPLKIQNWQQENWYIEAKILDSNFKIYNQYKSKAEEILFSDIEESIVVIEYVNKKKKIIHFIQNKNISGFFKYEGIIDSPKIGDIIKGRINKKKDGFYEFISGKIDNSLSHECILKFKGQIKIHPSGFGFVKDIFIDKPIVNKYNLTENQEVSGKAILSFDKKKSKWCWKAISVL